MNQSDTRRTVTAAQHGMTLTEIMVVVIIMALIASAVAAAVIPQIEKARIRQTAADVRTVRGAAQNFMAENAGAGCPTFDQLTLDRGARQRDAWDHEFLIECDGDGPIVSSRGPDGRPDTADDIRVPAGPRREGWR